MRNVYEYTFLLDGKSNTLLSHETSWEEAVKPYSLFADAVCTNVDMYQHVENETMSDFPKLQCPFVRKEYNVNVEQWKKVGNTMQLRTPVAYLVTNEIQAGFEWVFEDPHTIAVEKLDGTNVKVKIRKKRIVAIQNRLNKIDIGTINAGNSRIVEGVLRAIDKGYVDGDGEYAGELIGPKLQANPLGLTEHVWIPFSKAEKHLQIRSFNKYPKTFENISNWFEKYLKSIYMMKKLGFEDAPFAEGVVFYNPKRREQGLSWMAKLRRDMYPWYYQNKIEIYDLPEYWKKDEETQLDTDGDLKQVTCEGCGRVHVSQSRKELVTKIARFNEYYFGLSEESKFGFGGPDEIENYEKCFGCGGSYKQFRMAKEGDCPAGSTLTSIIYFKE